MRTIFLIILIACFALSGCALLKGVMDSASTGQTTPPPGQTNDSNEAPAHAAITSALNPYLGPLAAIVASIIIAILYQLKILNYRKVTTGLSDALNILKTVPAQSETAADENVNDAIETAFKWDKKIKAMSDKLYANRKATA